MLTRIAILAGVLVAGRAFADAGPPGAQIAVDFARPSDGRAWFAAGLEALVGRELLRFHQIRLVPRLDPAVCPARAAGCLVEAYRKAGADVVVLGRLDGPRLAWDVYPTWSGVRAFGGALAVEGVSIVALERHVGDILRPIMQLGGLLDQRPMHLAEAAPRPPPARAGPWIFRGILVGLALWLGYPPLLLLFLVGPRAIRRHRRPASWDWSAALAGVLLLVAALGGRDPAALAARSLPAWLDRTLPFVAGLLWGAFGLIHLRWVFPPIAGLGKVRHTALGSLLLAWLAMSLLRVLLLLAYAPVVLLTMYACDAFGLSARATWALAVPAAGLFALFWLLALVDNLVVFLDTRLVLDAASARNPWHGTMRRYLMGYLRRGGVELDPQLTDRTLLLPSGIAGVVSYGGGFAPARILVGTGPREAALGELPDEREAPEREVNQEELPIGLLVPESGGRDAPQRARLAADKRKALAAAPPRPSVPKPRVIGEHLTLLGWVLPQPGDEGVPLIAGSEEEYEVVRGLLQEHYAAFEKHLDDEEVDDTDPTQKDFLYGALIRELGAISRGDAILSTLRLSLGLAMLRASLPTRLLMRGCAFVYQRLLAGPGTTVADAYAAFHGGLHHLIQYLDLVRGGRGAPTARANPPRLIAASKTIFDWLEREPPSRDLLSPTPRNRLLALSRFFHAPPAHPWRRRAGLVAVFTLSALVTFIAVRGARRYHPIYLDRMQKLEAEANPPGEGAMPDVRPAE